MFNVNVPAVAQLIVTVTGPLAFNVLGDTVAVIPVGRLAADKVAIPLFTTMLSVLVIVCPAVQVRLVTFGGVIVTLGIVTVTGIFNVRLAVAPAAVTVRV
jgi:hypothetical protein